VSQLECPACHNPSRDGGLCDNDEIILKNNLDDVPWLLDQLLIQAIRQNVTSEAGASAETPLAFNEKAADLAAKYEHMLSTWARIVGAQTLAGRAAADWMRRNFYDVRIHPQAADVVDQIIGHAGECWHAIDRHGADLIFLGDCHHEIDDRECLTPIRARKGVTVVECWRCETRYDVAEMLAARDARINESLATAAEIAGAQFRTPDNRLINVKMIEGYLRRGTVAQHGTRRGKPIYRIGEVKEAAFKARYPKARLDGAIARLSA
jgi:hypothetical protein